MSFSNDGLTCGNSLFFSFSFFEDGENSTQMYYSKFTIDRNALANATRILQPFTSNNSLRVDDIAVTRSKDLFCF